MQKSPSNIDQGGFRKSIDSFKPQLFFCKNRNPHTKWLATTLSFIKPPTRMGSVNLELNFVETSLLFIEDMINFIIWICMTTKWGKQDLMESV